MKFKGFCVCVHCVDRKEFSGNLTNQNFTLFVYYLRSIMA